MPSILPVSLTVLSLLSLAACAGDQLPTDPGSAATLGRVDGNQAGLSDAWTTRARMPTGRSALAAASVGGLIYAIGGNLTPGSGPGTKVEVYYPSSTTLLPWRPRAPLPEPRAFLNGAAVLDGKIYVTGGYYLEQQDDETVLVTTRTLFRYDPAANAWTKLEDMPTAGFGGVSAGIGGRLYVYLVHGSEASPKASLFRYNPGTGKWVERAKPPAVQHTAASAVLDGKLYVIGGSRGKAAPVATVTRYDPQTNTWTTAEPLLAPRVLHTAVAIGGKIYVAGGGDGVGTGTRARTEVYDPASDTWSEAADIPTPRLSAAAAAVGGKMYVIGGSGGASAKVNEMYTP